MAKQNMEDVLKGLNDQQIVEWLEGNAVPSEGQMTLVKRINEMSGEHYLRAAELLARRTQRLNLDRDDSQLCIEHVTCDPPATISAGKISAYNRRGRLLYDENGMAL